DVVRAILKRELLGSTGIGRGVAIPHSKHGSVGKLLGTVAVAPAGVPFDSLDGEPVYIFVLLISPQDQPGNHLRALENVSRCLRDDAFVRALRAAKPKGEPPALRDRVDRCPVAPRAAGRGQPRPDGGRGGGGGRRAEGVPLEP